MVRRYNYGVGRVCGLGGLVVWEGLWGWEGLWVRREQSERIRNCKKTSYRL